MCIVSIVSIVGVVLMLLAGYQQDAPVLCSALDEHGYRGALLGLHLQMTANQSLRHHGLLHYELPLRRRDEHGPNK